MTYCHEAGIYVNTDLLLLCNWCADDLYSARTCLCIRLLVIYVFLTIPAGILRDQFCVFNGIALIIRFLHTASHYTLATTSKATHNSSSAVRNFGKTPRFHKYSCYDLEIMNNVKLNGYEYNSDMGIHYPVASGAWQSCHDLEILGQEIKVFVKCKVIEILWFEAFVDWG